MNRKERRAARKRAGSIAARSNQIENTGISHLFPLALGHHQAGHLIEAESIYRKVLATNPDHPESLHLLGVISHQVGRNDVAVDLIGKAIALNPRIPAFHYNIGSAFQALGRLDEAVAHYKRAIALEPDWAEAHMHLGNVLFKQGQLAEAAVEYERAVGLKSNLVEALYMLGNILQLQSRLEEAVGRYQQALAFRPNFAEVLNNLGNAFRKQGRLEEAVAQCKRSLAIKSDSPEALNNLAIALQEQGLMEDSIARSQEALGLRPDFLEARQTLCFALMAHGSTELALSHACRALEMQRSIDTKALFVQCVRAVRDPASILKIGNLRRHVIQALSEPWGRPGDLASISSSLIKSGRAISECIERATRSWPTRLPLHELFGPFGLAEVCENELLRCLLESTPVCDLELEQFLSDARIAMLEVATAVTVSIPVEQNVLSFCSALARQCYINEYVFGCTDDELEQASRLRRTLITALQSGGLVPELWLAAVAAYFPLHSLSSVESILNRPWSHAVAGLVAQQLLEPQEEQVYRTTIPCLTAIEDEISLLVQRQYEESPYPRWVKTAPMGKPTTVGRFLGRQFPTASLRRLGERNETEILIAGCGTGQQSIDTAQRFPGARVLAIDLSLTSLCYAERKTRELGLDNIQYAQADILQLGSIGRTFDVIEATGVLHHLADPIEGWRALLSILRPGGFMQLGIYSELARQDIIAVQAFISQRGYSPSETGIRRCRQELAKFDPLKNLTKTADFYSTSACRDLLFHVQEHRMTLPEIATFLTENHLKFLGFNIESQILMQFRQRFPWSEAVTDLNLWHDFETENPTTFIRMYQFWVQKE